MMVTQSSLLQVNGLTRRFSRSRKAAGKDGRPKILLTLKYNRATSVLSLVIHKAVNLQVFIHILAAANVQWPLQDRSYLGELPQSSDDMYIIYNIHRREMRDF